MPYACQHFVVRNDLSKIFMVWMVVEGVKLEVNNHCDMRERERERGGGGGGGGAGFGFVC